MFDTIREQLRRTSSAARTSGDVAKDDRTTRDAVIVRADEAGLVLEDIAAETGLAISHVGKILVKEAARRQDEQPAEPVDDDDEGPDAIAPGPSGAVG